MTEMFHFLPRYIASLTFASGEYRDKSSVCTNPLPASLFLEASDFVILVTEDRLKCFPGKHYREMQILRSNFPVLFYKPLKMTSEYDPYNAETDHLRALAAAQVLIYEFSRIHSCNEMSGAPVS